MRGGFRGLSRNRYTDAAPCSPDPIGIRLAVPAGGFSTPGGPMNKWLITASLLIVAAACEPRPDMAAPDGMRRLAPRAQLLDPTLQTALATAASTDSLVVIVNYDATATSRDAVTSAILGTGAGVIQFKHLALVAALATPSQIAQIAGLSG